MDVRPEAGGGGDERGDEGLAGTRSRHRRFPHPETHERLPRRQLREERRALRFVPVVLRLLGGGALGGGVRVHRGVGLFFRLCESEFRVIIGVERSP